jgi:hypothetical protein
MDEFLIPHANFKRLYEEFKLHGSLSIGVDFDNTVHDFHKKGYKYPIVTELLRRAEKLGMTIHIFTANPDHDLVKSHMEGLGVSISGINTDGVQLGWESRKPFYSLLLDDRAGLISAVDDLNILINTLEDEIAPTLTLHNN